MKINPKNTLVAFKKNLSSQLRIIHLYLNKIYYNLIFNQDEEYSLNDCELINFKNVENIWIEHEKMECYNKYDCYRPIKDSKEVENILHEHPVYNHSIFSYLNNDGKSDEIKHFISNDAILNLEFFDYLAYSIIGSPEQTKLEIISNLWNESGKGSVQLFHTVKFKNLMHDLELNYEREKILKNMSWEGIAVINLFSYLALYSSNKMKYFGLLAATEMLDPPHYQQLIKALNKLKFKQDKIDISYFREHASIDIVHASGWMNNVVIPTIRRNPNKLPEFWLGFYLRLDSAQRYYDKLLHIFLNKKAA